MLDDKTRAEIFEAYQRSNRSIQDIARIYRVTVEQVLHIIGEDELTTITTQGDLIDSSEAGPGVDLNYNGKQHDIRYTTD